MSFLPMPASPCPNLLPLFTLKIPSKWQYVATKEPSSAPIPARYQCQPKLLGRTTGTPRNFDQDILLWLRSVGFQISRNQVTHPLVALHTLNDFPKIIVVGVVDIAKVAD